MILFMTTNYERAFAPHPAVFEAWGQLNAAIKSSMDARRYELATLAAALALRSSYCSLAHGKCWRSSSASRSSSSCITDYLDLDHDMQTALVVGRAIEQRLS